MKMRRRILIVFSVLLIVLIGIFGPSAYGQTNQTAPDWGTYPADYREIVQQWIKANVFQPDSLRDLAICTPGKWWQRWSILKGGKTYYGYRVMAMYTPRKREGGYDKKQIHNFHIRNGEIVGEWKDKAGVAIQSETPEIQVRDLGVTASQDLNKPGAVPWSWVLMAELKQPGQFVVRATTPIDSTISTTFECTGPGKVFQPFFSATEFPSVWAMSKESGRHWMPFHFTFEDTATGKRFELAQWASIDFRDLGKLTSALTKEAKKAPSSAKLVQQVQFEFDSRTWKVGYSKSLPEQEITEYVLDGETVENWTELVTVQSFSGVQSRTAPEQTMVGAREMTLQQCPTAMWNVIRKDNTEILYEWQTAECPGTANEYEIAKVLKGKRAMYRIAYASKKLPVPDSDRALWMQLISAAKLGDVVSSAK